MFFNSTINFFSYFLFLDKNSLQFVDCCCIINLDSHKDCVVLLKKGIIMENKKTEMSKEEMVRTITRNIHADRRKSEQNRADETDYYAKVIKKKSRKGRIIAIVVIILLLASVSGVYLYGMNKTNNKFLPNTVLNGQNVGGKTLKEVYDSIMKSDDAGVPEKITLLKYDGKQVDIDVDTIGYTDNIKQNVTDFYNKQNHYLWFVSLFKSDNFSFETEYSFDSGMIEDVVKRKIIDASADAAPKDATIEKSDVGFVVIKEVRGGKIDNKKKQNLFDFVHEAIANGETEIDLADVDCYEQPKVIAEQLTETCQKLNDLSSVELTFDFTYKKEVLKGSEFIDWISFDNVNKSEPFNVDKDKAMEYVEKLADKYDTYGKDRTFNSTSRGTITVTAGQGCYGWWIDQEKTRDAIVKAIKECKSVDVEPIYYVNPDSHYEYTANPEWRTENSDIGDTYIEVDLKKQHLWFYQNGKLKYQCDIVSGMPTPERNTPEGVYKLWIKEKNKVLKGSLSTGETWETPVDFWNNISTFGIGLHDATWHTSFGGTRYKKYGSHGCVNMPYKAAEYVYKNVPIGTPCVLYW